MHTIVLLSVALSVLHAQPLEEEWQLWKERHGKSYQTRSEEDSRWAIWLQNYESIKRHNSQNSTFKLKLNEFVDMSPMEFQEQYLGTVNTTAAVTWSGACEKHISGNNSNKTYPSWLDWRIQGFVTEIKTQGSCSSSWAFSATGALEGQLYKKKRYLMTLSEQQLLDCSEEYGNRGCYGGLAMNAFLYVQSAGGICPESGYPYLGYVWQCVDLYCSKAATCSKAFAVESGSEEDLLDALYNVGPISVVVDGSGVSFQFYSDGIYSSTECSKIYLNQAMLLVGYGTDSTEGDYWILKNSLGTTWGMEGYMKMARNKDNMCGIATATSYPVL